MLEAKRYSRGKRSPVRRAADFCGQKAQGAAQKVAGGAKKVVSKKTAGKTPAAVAAANASEMPMPRRRSAAKTQHLSVKRQPRAIRKHTIYWLTTGVLGAILLVCGYQLMRWKVESDMTDEQIAQTTSQASDGMSESSDGKSFVDESKISKSDPYWDYMKMSLIDVDFDELKKTNSQTVGWIQVGGTNINYPFVQTSDNDFYLTHSFNRSYNSAGWVFLDYREETQLSRNQNSIIYAHGRVNGTMFGSLKNVLNQSWQDDLDNHIVKVSTPEEDTLWQVFSVYRTPVTDDYLQTGFGNETALGNFFDSLQSRSAYNFNTTVSGTDRILTLSTCIGTNDRVVLHAKLIKYLER